MEARKKTFNGIVVSDKMDKTIVVEVTNMECRHLSKDKCWRLVQIVEKAR